MTLGNTKAIDLIIEKDGILIPIQVKGIQRRKSICWNISLSSLKNAKMIFVLVNLNVDEITNDKTPEYFILTENDTKQNFKKTDSGRDYLDYNLAIRFDLKTVWKR